mmetsp:Transcript_33697/g.62024  ORF Transcript_33697/g.62024 Transcript_33697/m.62024 type:complete len:243 (-) Transcript_33697:1443-2171(-)
MKYQAHSLVTVAGSIASATRLFASDSCFRASSGNTGEFIARYAALRNKPAPNLRPNEGTLESCSNTKSLVSASPAILRSPGDISGMEGIMDAPSLKFSANALRKLLLSSRPPNTSWNSLAEESLFSSSDVRNKSSSTRLRKLSGRSIMAFLRSSGRREASCSDRSKASFGARSELAIVLARELSTSARRRRDLVAASPNLAASSTKISCNVDPSLSKSNFANSLAAAVLPSPSRSTVAVAAV